MGGAVAKSQDFQKTKLIETITVDPCTYIICDSPNSCLRNFFDCKFPLNGALFGFASR